MNRFWSRSAEKKFEPGHKLYVVNISEIKRTKKHSVKGFKRNGTF